MAQKQHMGNLLNLGDFKGTFGQKWLKMVA